MLQGAQERLALWIEARWMRDEGQRLLREVAILFRGQRESGQADSGQTKIPLVNQVRNKIETNVISGLKPWVNL